MGGRDGREGWEGGMGGGGGRNGWEGWEGGMGGVYMFGNGSGGEMHTTKCFNSGSSRSFFIAS